MNQFRHADHNRKINANNRRSGERIHHAALEDQVYVHQAITEDGIAERERQQRQRQHGPLHESRGNPIMQPRQNVGQHVEQREGDDCEHRAAHQPLHLLAQNRLRRLAVRASHDKRRRQKVGSQVRHLNPVKVELQIAARG